MLPNPSEQGPYIYSDISDLHDLVEFISDKLGNPVTIEAHDFELIAYSSNHMDFDVARRETILGKRVPCYIVDNLVQKGYVNQIESTREPVRIPEIEEVGLSQRVATRIEDQGVILGHIWVQETNRNLTKDDFSFLKQVVHTAAKIIIQKSLERKSKTVTKDHLLLKILQGQYNNERLLRMEADLAGLNIPSLFSVVIFYYPDQVDPDRLRNIIKIYCIYTGKTTYLIEKDRLLIVFVGSPSLIEGSSTKLALELVENISKKLDSSLEKHIHVGIGKEYDQLINAKNSFAEALEVINLSKSIHKSSLTIPRMYTKLSVYRLLPVIYEKNKEDGYLNPDIERLRKHDQENNAELLHTLHMYLVNHCKIKETAAALHIHPNTLNYRIKKITELTSISFEDMDQRVMLHIDLLLLNYK
ncbi:PucR family transcriptional regulator [Paenibacillus alkalitolerans]|uniref:PucR family transcriptional regulator n=1 Tax=Paenibacillus alkalitolerans TaxID=2799335 RepID=UPI0018F352B2|nr:helix-turn-helix domain-containing protein [Paenibacillus alkalitolerans]